MDGLLIIDKAPGMTSHDVVNHVRRILKTKRVGHTGTLDPFATGVLVLLVGKATRLAQFIDKAAKEYVAEIKFGFATNTGDVTGKPSVRNPKSLDLEDIERVLPRFRGEIEQVPPMFSAKKVGGRKLYELARKGDVVEREPFKATIHELAMLESDLDSVEPKITVRVICSAGTYIRTLAEGIGEELGTAAHLTSLRRTAVGKFDLTHAVTLDNLEKRSTPRYSLVPWQRLISHLPQLDLPHERIEATVNGLSTRVDRKDLHDGDFVSMFEPDGNIIAVGFYDASERSVRPKIVLV